MLLPWAETDWMSETQRDAVIDGMAEAVASEVEDYLYWVATGVLR